MNKSEEFDSKYVGYFLTVVFGEYILKVSSAQGTTSNINIGYMALDPMKLALIEGMYLIGQTVKKTNVF